MKHPVIALLICTLIVAPSTAFAGNKTEKKSDPNIRKSSSKTDSKKKHTSSKTNSKKTHTSSKTDLEKSQSSTQTDLGKSQSSTQTNLGKPQSSIQPDLGKLQLTNPQTLNERPTNEELLEHIDNLHKMIMEEIAELKQPPQKKEIIEEKPTSQFEWGVLFGLTLGWKFYLPIKRPTVCLETMDECSSHEGKGSGIGIDLALGFSFGTLYIAAETGFGLPSFEKTSGSSNTKDDSTYLLASLYAEGAIGAYPARFFPNQINIFLTNLYLEVGVGYSSVGEPLSAFGVKKVASLFGHGSEPEEGSDPVSSQISISTAIGTSIYGLTLSLRFRYFLAPMDVLSIIPSFGLRF